MDADDTSNSLDPLAFDLHPPLTPHQALLEADRCYFCYDAPCITACPTGIDIPLFIRQIKTGNPAGSAKTIFDENIFGGMCARVCPTETLCEQACVRNIAEDKPVEIGLLQRHATDHQMQTGSQPYQRAVSQGKRVAVVGAGPAGIACAHRLALHGIDVTVFDHHVKSGGLNEYGIAAYKTINDFAQAELDYILSIGGISVEHGKTLGTDLSLDQLKNDYDAVFLGIGLADVNRLQIDGVKASGVVDAVSFIAELRQSSNVRELDVGRQVVVIGGGMTAVDAAVQSKKLGSEQVTLVYRKSLGDMKASRFEQELAQTSGVSLRTCLSPLRIITGSSGAVTSVEFTQTQIENGQLSETGDTVSVAADRVLLAIGQQFEAPVLAGSGLAFEDGRISVNDARQSSDPLVWAGGDCIATGEDLTVSAVQDGKLAAESMVEFLLT